MLSGWVDLEFEDRKVRIKAGNSIMIPATRRITRPARRTRSNCWRYRSPPTWARSPATHRPGINLGSSCARHSGGRGYQTRHCALIRSAGPVRRCSSRAVGERDRCRWPSPAVARALPDGRAGGTGRPRDAGDPAVRPAAARHQATGAGAAVALRQLCRRDRRARPGPAGCRRHRRGRRGRPEIGPGRGAAPHARRGDRSPVLNNWDRLLAYLHAELSREPVEQFRVLFLDNRNRLLADEAQAARHGEPHAGLSTRGGV